MIRRAFCLLIAAFISLSLIACSGETVMEHCEIGMRLSSRFEVAELLGYDVAYSDGDLVVALTRISFTAAADEGIPASLSPEAFARLYVDKIGLSRESVREYGDFPYVAYTVGDAEVIEAFLRTPYAYFIVSFFRTDTTKWSFEEALSLVESIYLKEDFS